jgi:hypothetical protein
VVVVEEAVAPLVSPVVGDFFFFLAVSVLGSLASKPQPTVPAAKVSTTPATKPFNSLTDKVFFTIFPLRPLGQSSPVLSKANKVPFVLRLAYDAFAEVSRDVPQDTSLVRFVKLFLFSSAGNELFSLESPGITAE